MKLRLIVEFNQSPSDVIEWLEDYVDQRKGKFERGDDVILAKILGQYPADLLKRVGNLLGSSTSIVTARSLAKGVVDGELISYGGRGPSTDWAGLENALAQPKPSARTHDHSDMWEREPSQQELFAMENPDSTERFNNAPPAFTVKMGSCPAVRSIPENVQNKLRILSPASLIDNRATRPKVTQPFIYSVEHGLFVGAENSYHDEILNSVTDSDISDILHNIYMNGEQSKWFDYKQMPIQAGVVGRTGYDLSVIDPSLKTASVLAMYGKRGATENPGTFEKCVNLLVYDGYIPGDAIVMYPGKLINAQEATSPMELDDTDIKRSQLQAAYHIGSWPDGRKMTAQEKAALGKELGIGGDDRTMRKHPWQQAGENAGTLRPGQRWWAPHSESRTASRRRSSHN